MKLVFSMILLAIFSMGFAETYYVQDPAYNENASDSNKGTDKNFPWATWQHAIDMAKAGDIVFFRGGTWQLEATGAGARVLMDPGNREGYGSIGDSGTVDNHIVFQNYPGETPILDASKSQQFEEALSFCTTSYVEVRGLTVQGKKGVYPDDTTQIFRQVTFYNNGTMWIDRMVSRDSHGYGFTINSWDTVYITDCDSYDHYDSIYYINSGLSGNKPDGFAISSGGETTDYGYITGCRAWLCSDDGFELSWSSGMMADSLWSFCNGYGAEGLGVGIKYGKGYIADSSNRITQRSINAWNKGGPYSFQNMHHKTNGAIMTFKNNLAYKCGIGFGVAIGDWDEDNGDFFLRYYNNLMYNNSNRSLDQYSFSELASSDPIPDEIRGHHNTWIWKPGSSYLWSYNDTVSWSYDGEDSQFAILPDSATTLSRLSADRQGDGSLPDIGDLYHLAEGSNLIDAGVDVGLPYNGTAPDIGPFEYGSFSLQIVSPKKGEAFAKGDKITLEANFRGDFNDIRQVDFYLNDRVSILGSGNEISPSRWEYTWDNDTIGTFLLSASGINSQGSTAHSSMITVFIYPEIEPGTCNILPNPNNGIFSLELDEPLKTSTNVGIVSMDGRFVLMETMKQNEIVKYFDLSHLGSGIYNIILEDDQGFNPCVPLKMIKL